MKKYIKRNERKDKPKRDKLMEAIKRFIRHLDLKKLKEEVKDTDLYDKL